MKIKTLIIMGLGVCLSLIVLLGGIGIYQLNTSINKCKQVINVDSRVVEYSQRLRADFNIMRRFEKDIFINISDQAKVGEYRIKWNGAYEKSKLRLEALTKLDDEPEHTQFLVSISKELEEYKTSFNGVIEQIKSGTINSPEEANTAIQKGKESMHRAEATIESLRV